MERWTDCPKCGQRTRLTAVELETKRGFCARCDARFELRADMWMGDGPGRELIHVATGVEAAPPHSIYLQVDSMQPLEVEIRPTRSMFVMLAPWAGVAVFIWIMFAVLIAELWIAGGLLLLALFPILHLVGKLQDRWRPPPQRVEVRGNHLHVESARERQRLSIGDGADVAITPTGSVMVSNHDGAVEIGADYAMTDLDLQWLRRVLRASVRSSTK